MAEAKPKRCAKMSHFSEKSLCTQRLERVEIKVVQ